LGTVQRCVNLTTPKNTYLDLADESTTGSGQPNILRWTARNLDRIHLILTHDRLTDSAGEKPGLRLVFSSTPKSADCSPANIDRCAHVVRSIG